MIRSLYNLTKAINIHIDTIPIKTDFNLQEVTPILKNYIGTDWYDYKIKNSMFSKPYENSNHFQRIPVYFRELDNIKYSKLYDMYILVWNPYCHTQIHTHPEGVCLMKILEGSITQHRFVNAESFGTEQIFIPNDINFNSDNQGVYRFINNNLGYTYSLHIYSPALCDEKNQTNKTNETNKKTLKQSHPRVWNYPIM
jgi:hypothetical protein